MSVDQEINETIKQVSNLEIRETKQEHQDVKINDQECKIKKVEEPTVKVESTNDQEKKTQYITTDRGTKIPLDTRTEKCIIFTGEIAFDACAKYLIESTLKHFDFTEFREETVNGVKYTVTRENSMDFYYSPVQFRGGTCLVAEKI